MKFLYTSFYSKKFDSNENYVFMFILNLRGIIMLMNKNSELFDTAEAANFLRISTATLATWRTRGGGPRYIKVGRLVRYKYSSLQEFLKEREFNNTSSLRNFSR